MLAIEGVRNGVRCEEDGIERFVECLDIVGRRLAALGMKGGRSGETLPSADEGELEVGIGR